MTCACVTAIACPSRFDDQSIRPARGSAPPRRASSTAPGVRMFDLLDRVAATLRRLPIAQGTERILLAQAAAEFESFGPRRWAATQRLVVRTVRPGQHDMAKRRPRRRRGGALDRPKRPCGRVFQPSARLGSLGRTLHVCAGLTGAPFRRIPLRGPLGHGLRNSSAASSGDHVRPRPPGAGPDLRQLVGQCDRFGQRGLRVLGEPRRVGLVALEIHAQR